MIDGRADHAPELALDVNESARTKLPLSLTATESGVEAAPDPSQEYFLPVHGFVRLTRAESLVIDHPAMQRLGTVLQLGHSNLVYRGATHTRLEHSIGVVHVAERMVSSVNENMRKNRGHRSKKIGLGADITDRERFLIRLGALIHDVGHLPAGHTIEDELGLLGDDGKHDQWPRMTALLDRVDWPGGKHESLRALIDREYSWFNGPLSPSEHALAIVAKQVPDSVTSATGGVVRVSVCRDIVGNTICADLLDYLFRDWYHIGKALAPEDRIFQYMEIRDRKGEECFVISLGSRPKIRTDGVSAVLKVLELRYELAEAVLFHRTKCAAAAMLERGVQELAALLSPRERDGWRDGLVERLLQSDDQGVLDGFLSEANHKKAEAAIRPLAALRNRSLYKSLVTVERQEITPDQFRKIEAWARGPQGAEKRLAAIQLLEQDFALPAGALAIYCPNKGMNAKVAEVKIHVNGEVESLESWERANDNNLTGGHLQAQLSRFARLWRVSFVIDASVADELNEDIRSLLQQAVRHLVLGLIPSEDSLDGASRRLAVALSHSKVGPRAGQQVAEGAKVAAASRSSHARHYPSGAPSVSMNFDEI